MSTTSAAEPDQNPEISQKLAISKEARNADLVLAGISISVGLGCMVMVLTDPSSIQAPLWVVLAALSTFVLAGISFFGRGMGLTWLSQMASLGVVYALAMPGLWIMLGSGERSCSGSIGFFTTSLADFGCRAAFGVGGIVTLSFGFWMTAIFLRRAPKSE